MTIHKTICTHRGAMAFDAKINNHIIRMDTVPTGGGTDSGPSPKPLLLVALSGCSAMNIIKILNKMRVDFKDFEVEAIAELADEDPRIYTSIKLIFKINIDSLNKAKFEKALNLALEKYCSVYAMLIKIVPITSEIVYDNSNFNYEKDVLTAVNNI